MRWTSPGRSGAISGSNGRPYAAAIAAPTSKTLASRPVPILKAPVASHAEAARNARRRRRRRCSRGSAARRRRPWASSRREARRRRSRRRLPRRAGPASGHRRSPGEARRPKVREAWRRGRCSPRPRAWTGRTERRPPFGVLRQRERAPVALAVDRPARGCEEEALDLAPRPGAEQVDRAANVQPQVEDGVRDGYAARRSGRPGERPARGGDRRTAASTAVASRRRRPTTSRAPLPMRLSRLARLSGRQVVEHDHLVPALNQGIDEVGADESGAAGDQGLASGTLSSLFVLRRLAPDGRRPAIRPASGRSRRGGCVRRGGEPAGACARAPEAGRAGGLLDERGDAPCAGARGSPARDRRAAGGRS